MIGTQQQKFFTVKDVPAADFIKAYADFLKKNSKLQRPVWADYIKTSKAKGLAPNDEDFLYIRVASLARKIFIRPRAGVRLLSHLYGSAQHTGHGLPHHVNASGKVIRWGLQQLQKLKVIKKDKKGNELKVNSRIISKQGQKDLNRIATEVALANKKKSQ